MHRLMMSLFLLVTGLTARSQSFDYSVSAATETWQELSAQTILNTSNSAWNFAYKIPLGFTFNYLGKAFDSLQIETNGYLVFDADHNYSFTAYNNLSDRLDASGNHALIGYELSGGSGNHVLKIQFKNAGMSLGDSRAASYQVWLKENNTIEVHTGPTSFRPCIFAIDSSWTTLATMVSVDTTRDGNNTIISIDTSWSTTEHLVVDTIMTELDSTIGWRIGLINQHMDTEINGFFLKGDPAAPSSEQSDATHEPAFLNAPPKCGTRYTFSPVVN